MAAHLRNDADQEMTFVVKVQSFGPGDPRHVNQVGTVLWKHLNHGFGADRVQIWHEGKRIYFDPAAIENIA
jgi:hypothetical protein